MIIYLQIETNGYFSFDKGFYSYNFVQLSGNYSIVAPFFTDIDITIGGNISFQVYTRMNGSEELGNVSQAINDKEGTFFSGTWMVVAQWREVPRFLGFRAEVRATSFIKNLHGPRTVLICACLLGSGL